MPKTMWCVVLIIITGVLYVESTHHLRQHKSNRRYRALPNDGDLRFEPEPYSKKIELNSSGKIHCKVAGGGAPTVQWYLNDEDQLPEGVTSSNGTLVISEASRAHAGNYTCRATDDDKVITSKVRLDVFVSPRVIEPEAGAEVHVSAGDDVRLHCRAAGDPLPSIHWDRNTTILTPACEDVAIEGGNNSVTARILLLKNGTLVIRGAREQDTDRYGCTAGSAAGLDRHELLLTVHPEGELSAESTGVAGKAVLVSISVAAAYMILVLALMLYCRRRRRLRRERGEKMELEMTEGREKLVEEGEEGKTKLNGAPIQNGRLLATEKDSGADNSEVSAASRASKRSGQYDHLTVSKTLLTDIITLGRGEFGDVMLGKIDVTQVRVGRGHEEDVQPKIKPVLIKVLTTKEESQLAEFRRQLEMFSRVKHENVCRLIGLCNDSEPHYMLLEHTDWGDLKQFLVATRKVDGEGVSPPPLAPAHAALLASHLARAGDAFARRRQTHRDIAARNCMITSKLQLRLSFPALTRGPHAHDYYKLHDQVIPLRWLPAEAVLEGDYSTKSDVYMFAATVWEIYTKAELPFMKLNDNSVMERIKAGTLEWNTPDAMPEKLAALLRKCWSKSPSERPLFDAICEDMKELLKEITSDNAADVQQANDEKEEDGKS